VKLIDLPPNQHKSKSLDKGIDVFAPKYRQGSKRYQLQGLKRWEKAHPDAVSEGEFEPEDSGLSFQDTF
jgi:hypothetical protein